MAREELRLRIGLRLLLLLPAIACLQLPGWWKATAVAPAAVAAVGVVPWWRRRLRDWEVPGQEGRFPLDVVGVQHHATQVLALFPGRAADSEAVLPAVLVAEPANPLDPHSVAVHVGGATVGHLAPGLAAAVQPAVLELNRRGLQPRVDALVQARSDARDHTTLSVRLDLAGAEALRPP